MTARSVNDDAVSEISHSRKSGGRKTPLISITALPEFANQSLEELRAEHYEKLLLTGGVCACTRICVFSLYNMCSLCLYVNMYEYV